MAFNADDFKRSLSSAFGIKQTPIVNPKSEPLKINPSTFAAPAGNSNSTISVAPPRDPNAPDLLNLINPAQPVKIRPLFARADQTETLPVGGPVLGLVHDVVARTIEAVPAIAARTIANYRALSGAAQGQSGIEGRPNGAVNLPFDISRIGLSNEVGSKQVVDTGTAMMNKYNELETKNPGHASNIVLAALVPVTDAISAFISGDMLTSVAKQGLKVTGYSPDLEQALQQYGLKGSGLTGDDLANAIKDKFYQKGAYYIKAGDEAGFRDLLDATRTLATHMTGKGIPQLNTLGAMFQDISRLGLQDAKYGFTLKNPLFAELAPEAPAVGLPGYADVPGQAPAMGLSMRAVQRVGGAADEAGNFFRAKTEAGKPTFEPVEAKPVHIQENLDTGITKQPDGKFAVIEGKTGMQLGEPAATEALAVQSAWEEIQAIGQDTIQKSIDTKVQEGAIAPRYEFVPEKSPSVDQGLAMLPPELKASLAPIKRGIMQSASASAAASATASIPEALKPLAAEAKKYATPEEWFKSAKSIMETGSPELQKSLQDFIHQTSLATNVGKFKKSTGAEGIEDFYKYVVQSADPATAPAPGPVLSSSNLSEAEQGMMQKVEGYGATNLHVEKKSYPGKNGRPGKTVYAIVGDLPANSRYKSALEDNVHIEHFPDRGLADAALKKISASLPLPAATKSVSANPAAAGDLRPAPAKSGTYAVPAEPQAYEALSDNLGKESDYALHASSAEEEKIVDALTQIFADLKGTNIPEAKFTDTGLFAAGLAYKKVNDTLIDHPGRALVKYISKKSGLLPHILGDGADTEFGRKGKEILQKILDPEGTREITLEEGNKAIESYRALKKQVGDVQARFRSIRDEIRLIKQKNQFVESARSRLAARTMKDLKDLQALVKTAESAGYARGSAKAAEAEAKFQRMIERLKERRSKISALQEAYQLSDLQMKRIRGLADPRFMDPNEFDNYLAGMQKAAEAEQEKNIEKSIIQGIIKGQDLKNPENLRIAMELPHLNDMTLEQLQEYDNALSRYQKNDAFLGARMIQTITNTDLGDVKTVREIREALAKEAGVPLSALEDVRGDWTDKFTYDAALAEKNPLYKYMVQEFTGKTVETDQVILALEHKIDELAKAARKSARPKGILKKISDKLVPQDKKVFDWLERPDAEQPVWARKTNMTNQELEYAEFVKAMYRQWRDVLIDKGTLKKWREAYVTHTTQSFFEHWKDDGLVKAVGSAWKDLSDERIDFEAVGDTGEVLGLEKFFKYSLPRFGNMKPSTNVARVVMSYARSFYKKQALDAMIPKLEAYTFSLQRPQNVPGVPRDPTMVGIDGKMRKFVRQWLNNKKGRRTEYMISQGSKLDSGLRAFKLLISMLDLGVNIISNTANMIGNTMSNYVGMETKAFAKGAGRSVTKQGRSLMRKYPGVVGHPPFRRLVSAANDVGDTFSAGMFYLLSEGAYRSKGQFFLGSLTPEEYASGEVSKARQTEIKLEMGKFHPMEDMTSLVGSTSEGKLLSMYKTWAVPFLYTASRNSRRVLGAFKAASGASGKARVFKMKEARQLLKLTVGAAAAWLFWQGVFGNDDPKDQSPIAKLKRRISLELTSSLSALDPQTWLSVRPYEFAKSLAGTIHSLVLLERYQTTTDAHKAGDLQALYQLKSEFTPAAIRQFILPGGSGSPPIGPGASAGSTNNPSLKALKRLKVPSASNNASLKGLSRLKNQLKGLSR